MTDKKEIRKFGLIALALFGSLFLLALWRGKTAPTYFFGTLASFGLLLSLLPGPMAPLYRGWLKVAHAIGSALTTLIIALTYYIALTPTAVFKRIFGGIPIDMKIDKDRKSYWVEKSEGMQPKARFKKRF